MAHLQISCSCFSMEKKKRKTKRMCQKYLLWLLMATFEWMVNSNYREMISRSCDIWHNASLHTASFVSSGHLCHSERLELP